MIRAGRPTSVCVRCVRGSLLAASSGSPPPKLGAARSPQPPPFGALLESSYSPRLQTRRGAGRRGRGPVQHPLSSLRFSPQTLEGRVPRPQPPVRAPSRPHLSPGALSTAWAPVASLRRAAPPSAPAGYGRSRLGAAAAASTATGSLPASGQRRPPALLSMSRHRPRPGLRLGTARAGAAVQAPAPAGSGHSSPGGFASAPRSRSPSV